MTASGTATGMPGLPEVWQWQEQLVGFGTRYTGSSGHAAYVDWLAGQLSAVPGFRMRTDRLTFSRWLAREFSLTVSVPASAGRSGPVPLTYYYPYSGQTPPGGVSGRLVDLGLYPLPSGYTEAFWAPARGGIALIRAVPPEFSLDVAQTATGGYVPGQISAMAAIDYAALPARREPHVRLRWADALATGGTEMLRPFPGFATNPTHHCVTGSLKHVYDYHDFPVSEDLLLGLGRGLGFVYFHIKGTDPFYGGRANVARPGEEGLEKTVGRRTGVAVESHATSSARTARAALRELLEADEPVLVYLDMGFLPYFQLPAGYHFGGHVVVVAGYDPDTRQVLVADRDRELHPVGWDALEKARGSRYKPFPPRHTWYTFDFAAARPPAPAEVRESIGEVCHGMLRPPIANLGVKGIRKAIRETVKWPEVLDAGAVRRTCLNVAMFIDRRGGTGGGIFRYMYARFLGEAASITGETRLRGMGTELTAIGDRWEQVAAAFATAAQADNPADLLESATKPMHDIADLEQDFWERLGIMIAT